MAGIGSALGQAAGAAATAKQAKTAQTKLPAPKVRVVRRPPQPQGFLQRAVARAPKPKPQPATRVPSVFRQSIGQQAQRTVRVGGKPQARKPAGRTPSPQPQTVPGAHGSLKQLHPGQAFGQGAGPGHDDFLNFVRHTLLRQGGGFSAPGATPFEANLIANQQNHAAGTVLNAAASLPGKLPNIGLPKNTIGPKVGIQAKEAGFGGDVALRDTAREALNLPGNVAQSTYLTAHALARAALNHPDELKQLGHQFVTTDPIALGVQGQWGKAEKAFEQHPLGTVLETVGVKSALGRGVGAAGRLGGVEAAGTGPRPTVRLYGNAAGGPEIPRGTGAHLGNYSRDIFNRTLQRAGEKAQAKENVAAGRHPNAANPTRPRLAPFMRPQQTRMLLKRVDDHAAMTNDLSRSGRAQSVGETRQLLRQLPSASHRSAVPLIVARVVRKPSTLVQDLSSYRDTLTSAPAKALYRNQAKARVALVGQIDKLLGDRKFLADPQAAFDAAKTFTQQQGARESELVQLNALSPEEQDAKLIPYAIAHMDAQPSKQAFLQDQAANEITPAAIRAHLTANKVEEPGFFSQRNLGHGAFYKAFDLKPRRAGGVPRTGRATLLGAFDASPEALIQQAGHSRTILEQAKGVVRAVNELGLKKPHVDATGKVDGSGFWTDFKGAQRAANDLGETQGVELTPVNVGYLAGIQTEGDLLHPGVPSDQAIGMVSDRLRQSLEKPPDGKGKFVLVPRQALSRLYEHATPQGSFGRTLSKLSSAYKQTILGSSPKWPVTEAVDLGSRNLLQGAGPASWVRGRKLYAPGGIVDQLNPELGRQMRAQAGIGLGHTTENTSRFTEPSFITRSGPLKWARVAWGGYWKGAIKLVKGLEDQNAYTALGKTAKDDIARTVDSLAGFFKLGGKGLDDFANGLHATPNQIKAAYRMQEVVGRWQAMSPASRRVLVQYTPFGQWARVAFKYIYATLPTHHPIKVALAAAMSRMTEQERKQLGLDFFAGDATRLKAFEQGGLDIGGQIYRVSALNSFGIVNPEAAPSFVFPQLQPALDAFRGIDWRGQQLKDANGRQITDPLERAWLAANLAAEGLVPFFGLTQRAVVQGGTQSGDSTIFAPKTKPGTKKSAGTTARNILLPELRGYAPQTELRGSGGGGSAAPGWGGGAPSAKAAGWGK